MQLATPFLIPSATVIAERTKKTKLQPTDSQNALIAKSSVDQLTPLEATIENPNELAHQNLARLLASCGDCV